MYSRNRKEASMAGVQRMKRKAEWDEGGEVRLVSE